MLWLFGERRSTMQHHGPRLEKGTASAPGTGSFNAYHVRCVFLNLRSNANSNPTVVAGLECICSRAIQL